MQPLDFGFIPSRFNIVKKILNFVYVLFWTLIVLHLGALQVQTLLMNLDKTLDESMDYIMIGSIYFYGYFFTLLFFQFNSKKLLRLFEFIEQNFQSKSTKGKNDAIHFEVLRNLKLNNFQAQDLSISTKQWSFHESSAYFGCLRASVGQFLGSSTRLFNV